MSNDQGSALTTDGSSKSTKGNLAAATTAWIALAAVLGGALIGVGGSLLATRNTNNATHTEAANARRSAAYSAYLGELAKFNEMVYSAASFSGTNKPQNSPDATAGRKAFWPVATQSAENLQSDYVAAMLATAPSNKDATAVLTDISNGEQGEFKHFKCAANLQSENCTINGKVVSLETNKELMEELRVWSFKNGKLEQKLLDASRKALN
ncbi:hypothetical protein [Flexivirga alba]|uniref:Uncharacterized protein n=1 Tax=Flexivirga alba TaxID=702742 RepID=A0ABW2AIL2_9MICO